MLRMESIFQTKFLSMGFSREDLYEVSILHVNYDKQLRKTILGHFVSRSVASPERCLRKLDEFFAEEKKLFKRIIETHVKNKKPIKPYVVRPGEGEGGSYIEIMHMITWKQREMKAAYFQSFNKDEKINEKLIDWGMVAKDMVRSLKFKFTLKGLKI